ncbi:uncharacterized protein I303_106086 [Kwoniella dejecticola CBS 10117]|uniref:Uncharacterized protein n=1 Tax=Kwoniella dejecticola CBS 10117 TaxID=1296121 RepID=A0A1A6A196_9TREE|nr:uncharacterized protein I303_06105 [Kwoniella dejecticola CBS 10117]OBR83822.1 hypothetical protein I303_06105 [Kwoniella dejecticola CBS 10117]
MTHSSLFSPNNHFRHSHYLQPEGSLAPPSSFSKNSTGFLKKIPSVLFNKEKTPIKKKASKASFRIHADPSPKARALPSNSFQPPSAVAAVNPTITGEKDKKTKKPRKALADLFGWGNHHHSNDNRPEAASPVHEKATYGPAVPPKDNPAMLKKLNRPPSTKSSQSNYGSLRPTVQPIITSRPSIGDDPFVRNGEGAEVVEHVYRYTAQTPSAKSIALDRRASVSSSKAMSYKTVSSDVHSTKEVAERNPPLSAVSITEQRRISAPLGPAPLVDLPPRAASLGRVLGATMAAPLPQLPESPIEAEDVPIKTLKKEKTKSRVWGLLGRNKSKKEKVRTPDIGVPTLTAKEPWAQPTLPTPSGSLVAHIDDKYAAATLKSNVNSMRSTAPHRPPVLHISAPSTDNALLGQPPATASSMVSTRTAKRSTFDDHETSLNSTPSKYPVNSGRGGVWESVVGTSATRICSEEPCHAIEALMGPSRLPKRKSLTGLFGVAIKRSFDRIKPSSPPRSHRPDISPPRIAAEPTLRPLSEEIEEASKPFNTGIIPSDKFTSRFSLHEAPESKKEEVSRRDPSLRRVASATDKLFNLVSCLEFSPASSNSPTIHRMGSRNSFNGSPTPVRRVRSALLSSKVSVSSLKPPSVNISPLKIALHRAQAAANQQPMSPPRESLVRKGMRNIFSPPSPVPQKHGALPSHPELTDSNKSTDERAGSTQLIGATRNNGQTESHQDGLHSDLPEDLRAFFGNTSAAFGDALSPVKATSLGLPAPPPQNRKSSRRCNRAPPALSLPPVPDVPMPATNYTAVCLDVQDEDNEQDLTMQEDMLSVANGDRRNSFDFTNEYASLDQGDQRASFVEALRKVNSNPMMLPALPPVPALPDIDSMITPTSEVIPSFHISKPSDSTSLHEDSEDEDDDGEFGDDETLDDTAVINHVVGIAKTSPVRREPFRGQFAFQQHVATMPRHQESHASFGAPEPVLSIPEAPAPGKGRRGHHKRGESGISIATMSSIGSVIGTGNEREYTNYFDVNFTNNQNATHTRHHSTAETIDEVSESSPPRRVTSQDSISSSIAENAGGKTRPTTRRGHHHRRNSSIVSVNSLSEAIGHNLSVGPPVSLHNSRRPSYGYISKHRRNASSESSFGRPDWAAHRRKSSSVSTAASNFSISQIARPGLGDRMFQLDGGVQLTSITGSPPDAETASHSNRSSAYIQQHQRESSWDSLFDGTQSKIDDSLFDHGQQSRDSMFDSDSSFNRSSADGDSLFGPEQSSAKKPFFLKSLRPVSTVSTATSVSNGDDTFQHVQNYIQNVVTPVKAIPREIQACLQAEGEDTSNMTPLIKAKVQSVPGRQMLGSSMSRPAKPDRRRPAQLILAEPPLETPGLTSPSASETSSRLSLDTNAASITLGHRIRPIGAGHYRQKSSAGVKVEATIHEMPSMATLRAKNSPRPTSVVSREPKIVGVDDLGEREEVDRMKSVRKWVEWEREALDEFRKTKTCWRDSEESKHALDDWKMPTTPAEIALFLAQSSQAYKPLDQIPLGRSKIAHRRKSSLSDSRAMLSPYGLPLPRPPPEVQKPKSSLTTKYQKKGSTSSTISATSAFAFAFPFPDDAPASDPALAPAPSVFDQFAKPTSTVLSASTIADSASAGKTESKPFSPFSWTLPSSDKKEGSTSISAPVDHFGVKRFLEPDTRETDQKRNRVTSTARRQALGWGRRRNSDGPETTIGLGYNRNEDPPMPKSAVPLQLRDGNLGKASSSSSSSSAPSSAKPTTTKNGGKLIPKKSGERSKDKKTINIFQEVSGTSKRNIFAPTRDQENTSNQRDSKSKLVIKGRSPIKKKALRQVVSQPRALRV